MCVCESVFKKERKNKKEILEKESKTSMCIQMDIQVVGKLNVQSLEVMTFASVKIVNDCLKEEV